MNPFQKVKVCPFCSDPHCMIKVGEATIQVPMPEKPELKWSSDYNINPLVKPDPTSVVLIAVGIVLITQSLIKLLSKKPSP